jgi:His-Xaa-Ser system protein HxsD
MADEPLEVTFAAAAHSADAIQRAAYKFTDHFTLELQHAGDNHVCLLRAIGSHGPGEETVDAFRVEVLDQVLRERIRDETAEVRNVILALAFSKVGGEFAGVQPADGDLNAAPSGADDVTD